MKRIICCLFVILIICIAFLSAACSKNSAVKIGDKTYYLLIPYTLNEVSAGMFNKKELFPAKIDEGIIAIPHFKYSGQEGESWKYSLLIDVYLKNADAKYSISQVEMISPDSTMIASADNGFIEKSSKEEITNGISRELFTCKDFAVIPESILNATNSFRLVIHYCTSGEEGINEYKVDVSSGAVTLIDYMFE